MIDKVFSRLTVLSLVGTNKYKQRVWLCQCECGNRTQVPTLDLNSGNTKSCGCLSREKASQRFTKHGYSRTRLYHIWSNMRHRCYDSKSENYKWYGLLGIAMCDAWRDNFLIFQTWAMSSGYRDDLTIDRYPDRNGNYEPGNCRWVTMTEQARNRSSTILTEDDVRAIRNDPRKPRFIAREYGISPITVNQVKRKSIWNDVD